MNAQPSTPTSIDAPVEGWDAFNAKDNMPPNAAIVLDNLIPGAGAVATRAGHVEFVDTGTGLPVESVMSLESIQSKDLVMASNGGVWTVRDFEDPLPIQIAAPGTFQSDRWQDRNFTEGDEDGVIIMCNGIDTAQVYDGANLTPLDTSGSDPAVDPDFIGVEIYKGRAYYWKDNDNAFYYAQAGSYRGELEKFDLGTFVQQGGFIKMIVTWTQSDAGDGRDDFIVFVFSTGEILVYQGDDPGTAGYWEMVGRYTTAEPLSIRGSSKYGSDTIIMTKDGYVALSTILQQGRTSDVPAFSRLIHRAVIERTSTRSQLYGWECNLFPKEGLFIFNVPLSDKTFEQHVMNTVTNRWCRFTNINVICAEIHDERMFAGTFDGKIVAVLEGQADLNNQINFTCLYAYQHFDNPGVQKHLLAAQILSTHPDPRLIELSGYADYEEPILTPLQSPTPRTAATWSVNPASPASVVGSYWDEDYWAAPGNPVTTKGWQNVSAYGYGVSLLVRFALASDTVIWRSTGLRFFAAGAH